ncbi:SMC-Scp complex subunit ScpB [Billgrantia kenyensis]|uniref:SMC-Scp complex subunit ScpB n=1 Tax=Billgrantia kenyensis TaxID=321266 RepID=A0A7V9W4R5_9GAMM|nr:SMC-Scp complex subunit ScpB [Halomonas kenyensis]MBA2781037.1 SMC-Scp complex subunit ScpB [Halomonas kenyensis]MCG6663765.1 SMC-Scp complex subunit ScpB [Halomonas kenyensis]
MTAMELPDSLDDILEAALLAAAEPLSLERLEGLFDEHERPRRRSLREALERVAARHVSGAMELIETASGYQLRIRPRLSPWVSRLWDERPQRYSRALLETLALIAYRQPVTRGDIEEVRGVAVSSSIMRTLAERGWVRVVGHRDVPGRPAVYATTRQFLDDFGLKTLDELPPMHELKGMDEPVFEDEAPPPPSELLAQADAPLEDETVEAGDMPGEAGAEQDPGYGAHTETTAGTADAPHAGKASDRPGLSFADLEARLAERARTSVDDDGGAGAESTENEKSE